MYYVWRDLLAHCKSETGVWAYIWRGTSWLIALDFSTGGGDCIKDLFRGSTLISPYSANCSSKENLRAYWQKGNECFSSSLQANLSTHFLLTNTMPIFKFPAFENFGFQSAASVGAPTEILASRRIWYRSENQMITFSQLQSCFCSQLMWNSNGITPGYQKSRHLCFDSKSNSILQINFILELSYSIGIQCNPTHVYWEESSTVFKETAALYTLNWEQEWGRNEIQFTFKYKLTRSILSRAICKPKHSQPSKFIVFWILQPSNVNNNAHITMCV